MSKMYLLALVCILIAVPALAEKPVDPLLREEKTVIVDGTKEVWQLRWLSQPQDACFPQPGDVDSCPCWYFEYGEVGELSLVRLRDGKEVEHLDLDQFFNSGYVDPSQPEGHFLLRHWPVDEENDFPNSKFKPIPSEEIHKRPALDVMDFVDYDHDGRATEFFLPNDIEDVVCSHTSGFIVGISKNNPHLHAFGTASHPDKPLYIQTRDTEALKKNGKAVEFGCGDHGSDEETDAIFSSSAKGIIVTRKTYQCSDDGKRKSFISTDIQ